MNLVTKVFNRIFKSGNQQELDTIKPLINEINSQEETVAKLKNHEFIEKTRQLKKNLKEGRKLDSIIPESFALVREAAKELLTRDIMMFSLRVALSYTKEKLLR